MEDKLKILLVDDEASIRSYLKRMLNQYHVEEAADGQEALSKFVGLGTFDVVITDIKMPKMDGYQLTRLIIENAPDTVVSLMTGFPDVEMAVEIIKCGAFDYLLKPFEPEFLELKLNQIVSVAALKKQNRMLCEDLSDEPVFQGLVGKSREMLKVKDLIRKASRRKEINVLITGETGTGKEVVARAIHNHSLSRGSFVAINCGALPRDLAESELFGHSKGAFTGANSNKPGLFEEAGEGTVFLDEINSLPLDLQVKLNRAIEQREARRIGSTQEYLIQCRFVAATNQPLENLVKSGAFREDLVYRLRILEINLPALRDRKEDLPLLTRYFLNSLGEGRIRLSENASAVMMRYNWPGNIRELRHCIESACLLCESDIIEMDDLPVSVVQSEEMLPNQSNLLSELNYQQALEIGKSIILKEYLPNLMKAFNGNVSAAAQKADIQRETLHRLLKKIDIDPADFRSKAPTSVE